MPVIRSELSARGRARVMVGKRHDLRARPLRPDTTQTEKESLLRATKHTLFAKRPMSPLSLPRTLLPGRTDAHPVSFIDALKLLQASIAVDFIATSPKGEMFSSDAQVPRQCTFVLSQLAVTVRRNTADRPNLNLASVFSTACAFSDASWEALIRGSTLDAPVEARQHQLDRLHLFQTHTEEKIRGSEERLFRFAFVHAAILAGQNRFCEAHDLLLRARRGGQAQVEVVALEAFVGMLSLSFEPRFEARKAAIALVYGHLSGAPRLALLALAIYYERRGQNTFATLCFVLAATRPASSAVDTLTVSGLGYQWLRLCRFRADQANWLDWALS